MKRGRSRCHDLPPAGPVHLQRLPRTGLQPRRAYKTPISHSGEYPIVIIGWVAGRGSKCSRLVAEELQHAVGF